VPFIRGRSRGRASARPKGETTALPTVRDLYSCRWPTRNTSSTAARYSAPPRRGCSWRRLAGHWRGSEPFANRRVPAPSRLAKNPATGHALEAHVSGGMLNRTAFTKELDYTTRRTGVRTI